MKQVIYGMLILFVASLTSCTDLIGKSEKKEPCNQILIQQRVIKEKLKRIEKKMKRKR
mgnify:CR=1 FL=1